ncbi:hypothetical protein [Arthrobacter sp. AFG20]|uniref:hypothetical protein n=1 Tax=Arthrobacter sp. AFG20 TaxID=1688671 RepID=UPI000C9E1BB3|nr:hypothetical protein [Arthrobacter sp. AFG20]PNH86629.1 hypothetical protein CXZ05_01190 [Arthrobacter sp. AFG20]
MDTHREASTVFDLFFWIIILAVLVPMGMRMYRRSVQQRNQGPGLPGQFPGGAPDQFGNQPGSPFGGPFQGRPDNRPRDGYSQQDYFSGGLGFPQRGGREELPPLNQPYPPFPQPGPNQPYPNQPGPGGTGAPSWQQGPVPYEDSPEYRANPPRAQQNPARSAPPPPSAPQGFRARKLAELDQQYSDGQISMEEYMARRNDIMNG